MKTLKGLPLKYNGFNQIETKDGFVIANDVRPDDAEYIVKAADLYPELVAMLEKIVYAADDAEICEAQLSSYLMKPAKELLKKT